VPARADRDAMVTSVKTGRGIEELRQCVVARVCGKAAEGDDSYVVTTERQRSLVFQAAERFSGAGMAVDQGQPIEVVALEVREGTQCLAAIVGEEVGEEVLDELFGRFCIGK